MTPAEKAWVTGRRNQATNKLTTVEVAHGVEMFRRDDSAYLRWIGANPDGYVLNTTPGVSSGYLKLHSATCPHVSDATVAPGAWTERDYIKVCSANRRRLVDWVLNQAGQAPDETCGCRQ